MAELVDKYVKTPELLPFLDAAPAWFRTWICALVALNLLSTAVASIFYLSYKGWQARSPLYSLSRARNATKRFRLAIPG